LSDLSPERRRLVARLLERQTPRAASPATAGNLAGGFMSTARDASYRKQAYRDFYDTVNRQLDASEAGRYSLFLNYGYVGDGSRDDAVVELPARFLNRNSARLVLELIGDCPVGQRAILDVGCGRGGALDIVHRFLGGTRLIGIDLSYEAVAFCRRQYRSSTIAFIEGDAERLPVRDESFDVVINLESSHSYPTPEAFFQEVRRVLRTGGWFLFADLLPIEVADGCRAMLVELGFSVVRDRDVTANVLVSCEQLARRRMGAFDSANDTMMMNNFLATPESAPYREMKQGRWQYRLIRLRKEEGHGRVIAG
jgi:SAM-dependent methyltransferase